MNAEISNQFVSYEIALKLKKLGFNETCLTSYNPRKKLVGVFDTALQKDSNEEDCYVCNSKINTMYVSAPLWQQCLDYLRLTHTIDVVFVPPHAWQVQAYDKNMTVYNFNLPEAKTIQDDEIEYHKAKEQATLKALELIEKQK